MHQWIASGTMLSLSIENDVETGNRGVLEG